ncbi:MAG: glutamate synthase subunit alpha, partial [Rhizobiales bacterium]|nr:glutamate synthase subunit alpha [Hyphomicrobiales bacterium]
MPSWVWVKWAKAMTAHMLPEGLPAARGLYDPRNEHDACGIGLLANINNLRSHRIISDGLSILKNLEHRGAVGADPKAGDGAGIMIQIPHGFFVGEAKRLGFELPAPQHYGVAFLFMPREPVYRQDIERIWWETAREEGLKVLGWRDVPVDSTVLGTSVKPTEPVHRQVFIGKGPTIRDETHFERKLFVCRKVVSNRVLEVLGNKGRAYYPVSVSTRTIVYKGLVLGKNLGGYYLDLADPRFESAFALVHQRFSTNTFPSW